MPGYRHYSYCTCGWCVKFSRRWARSWFDSEKANALVILRERSYRTGSYASCFVNPNARCFCGARVFFYANSHGSRVFFDELGGRWPKHACTDQGRDHSPRTPTEDYPRLQRRARGEIDEIFDNLAAAQIDPRAQSLNAHGEDPESVFRVETAIRRGFANLLRAVELVGGEGDVAYFRFDSAKYVAQPGDIFSTDGKYLSFRNLETDQVERFMVSSISAAEFDAAANLGR